MSPRLLEKVLERVYTRGVEELVLAGHGVRVQHAVDIEEYHGRKNGRWRREIARMADELGRHEFVLPLLAAL